jgi:hypothetical protein
MPESNSRNPKCPYLSSIGMDGVQCTLHCLIRGNHRFDNPKSCNSFTKIICFNDFDKCLTYQNIYAEEMASIDKRILEYRKCAFCCNSSGYTGLKINHGSTHCYCQKHGIEVENYNPLTVCDCFNKKVNSKIENLIDLLLFYAT